MAYPDPRFSTAASLDRLYTHVLARRLAAICVLFLIGTTGIDLRWGPDLQTYLPIVAQ